MRMQVSHGCCGAPYLEASVWVKLSALAAAGYVSLELVECLFLLAPLVVVPLGVELVTVRRQEQPSDHSSERAS